MSARLVVVHGQADAVVEGALRAVGLELLGEAEGTELWGVPKPDGTQGQLFGARPGAAPGSGAAGGTTPAAAGGEYSGRRLLTVIEAGRVLGLGRSTMYQLIARGEIESVHVGRCARIPADAVDGLIDRLRTRAG